MLIHCEQLLETIRSIYHYTQAKKYIKDKYNGSEQKSNEIEWKIYYRRIKNQWINNDAITLKTIHSFILSRRMNFDIPHKCKHYQKIESHSTSYHYFLHF